MITVLPKCAAVACLIAAPLAAQLPGPTLQSQRDAVRILSRAFTAHGGYASLRGTGVVRLRMQVTRYEMLGQQVRPDVAPQPRDRPLFLTLTSDLARDRQVVEIFPAAAASDPAARLVWSDSAKFGFVPARNTVQDLDERQFRYFARPLEHPVTVLMKAWDRVATARSLGRQRLERRAYDVITYADRSGGQPTLFFDARTGQLARVETVEPNEPFGLGVLAITFTDYRTTEALTVPFAVTVTLGGRTLSEATLLDLSVSATLDESVLRRPEGATAAPAPPSGMSTEVQSLTVTRVAEGIYSLRDVTPGYHALFVEEPDHIIVIEAHGDQVASESVLRTVRETIPGKPIRTVVLTHHHFDHAGGLWTFMDRGITVVTTPGNEAFVRAIAAAPRTRDGRVADPPRPVIEVVRDRRVYGSGTGTVELFDVGPNPHADHILVAYLPSAKILYVPDIYGYVPGFTPPPLLTSFAQVLEQLSLDIETFVTAHTEPATWAEYEQAVAQARAAAQAGPR